MKYFLVLILFSSAVGELIRIPILTSNGISLVDLSILITFIFWTINSLLFNRDIKLFQGFYAIFGFLLIGLISLIWNVSEMGLNLSESINSLFYLVRYGLLASLILITFNLKKEDKNFVLNGIFLTSFIIFILGIIQLKFFPNFEKLGMDDKGWDPHIGRMLSTWFDPNFLGGYFALIASIAVGKIFYEVKKYKLKIINGQSQTVKNYKEDGNHNLINSEQILSSANKGGKIKIILLGILVLCLIAGIMLTYSRSALLALITSFGIIGIFISRKFLIIGIIALILGLGVSDRAQERFLDGVDSAKAMFLGIGNLDPTAKLRVDSWKTGIEIFKENPVIGIGYNTLKYEQKKKWAFIGEKHGSSGIDSSVLTIMATTGILGTLAFFMFLFQISWNFLSSYLRGKNFTSIGILAGIGGVFIHSVFVNSLFFYLLLPSFFIGIGVLIGESKK